MNNIVRLLVSPFILAFSLGSQAGLITLDQWNSTELQATGDKVELSWVDGGNTLSIQWFDGADIDVVTPVGLDKIGFNYNGALTLASATAGWGVASGGSNVADFGSFNIRYREPGSTDGFSSAIELTFAQQLLDANFFANSDGNIAVAHVRYTNDCSGFVGDGGPSNEAGSAPNCGSRVAIPEPGSLAMLAIGLVGLSWSRKMLSN